jgi:tripartite-type tricarboxylate transporter receptor subunit TctC
VPYRANPAQLQDLIAGRIDLMIDLAASALPQIRAGTIKAYAVADKVRLAVALEIPTVDEAGVPGFYLAPWHAVFVPRGTPPDVIAKLNRAAVDALADPTVRSRLTDLGQDIPPREQQTPQALGALNQAEIDKWWPIVKAAGIKAE